MSVPVMILGKTGSGKSFSMRNLEPESTLTIKCVEKPLPFRNKNWVACTKQNPAGSLYTTDDWSTIIKLFKKIPQSRKSVIIVDDFQYIMANEFMRRALEKGFDKFTELGMHAWSVIMEAMHSTSNCRFYFLSHSEQTDHGEIKCKTIGKLLDEKITLEGLFTIVLRAVKDDSGYKFITQSNGQDTCKSPFEMFDRSKINNDLKEVDKKICEYYTIPCKPPNNATVETTGAR